ncbi:MAG TPA: autotransporter domain-containing protein [Arenimonas sp.]|uniref:autotransporter domain-containing protein n=1 Tax=Arenimonas sp. TaxID=1872635 RepID=UPI002B82A521|nr:autotransporter domain-containing protein [Arenimonas sp.]HMB57688.1 autotransporter domain-containing protein [Arenimonas sp.]
MPRIHQLAGALALALAGASVAQAQEFTGVVTFGDSLSDAGNIAQLSALPAGNSFTTNPDPVAAQIIAAAFGYNQTNSLAGGSNYAYGGACANVSGPCINPGAPRLGQQLAQYLTPRGGRADGNALYTVWMGANDIFANLGGGVWTTQAQIQAGTAGVATSVITNVLTLQAAGANYIVVFNLPDLGATPQFVAAGPTAAGAASFASVSYNAALNQGLSLTRVGIIPINTYALVSEVMANPTLYGFTNVSNPACTVPSSVACSTATLVAPNANNTYLFADGVHPTGAGHATLASVVIATIEAPGQVSLAGEVPLQVYEDHSSVINNKIFHLRGTERPDGDTFGYANLQIGSQNYDRTSNSPETDSNLATITAGADFRYSDSVNFGGAISVARSNGDFGAGSLDGTEVLASVYATKTFGNGYIDGIVSGGSNGLDIGRDIVLHTTTRHETGNTDARHLALEFGGGYDFGTGDLHHGVFANAVWQKVSVKSYAEEGGDSTAMNFGGFDRDSLVWRVGYQIEGAANMGSHKITPYGRLAYAGETKNDATSVLAGSNSMNGHFQLDGIAPSNNWVEADLGFDMQINEHSQAFFAYRGHLGDDTQHRNSINVGVSMTF